ncbi:uncharacterized protein V1513DRAFT_320295 [Lipomyces chichibuensis]|uniref:uncharacterized protein n=1 Tax=Lipomyces chichibuensis TaxID=1546026 RepID=UPI003342F5CC
MLRVRSIFSMLLVLLASIVRALAFVQNTTDVTTSTQLGADFGSGLVLEYQYDPVKALGMSDDIAGQFGFGVTLLNTSTDKVAYIDDKLRYSFDGNQSNALMNYLQILYLKDRPESINEVFDWIDDVVNIADAIDYNSTAVQEELRGRLYAYGDAEVAEVLRKRWLEIPCSKSHALIGNACSLWNYSGYTRINHARNLCQANQGDVCCPSRSKVVSIQVAGMGYVAASCENSCTGTTYSCVKYGYIPSMDVFSKYI